MKKMRKTLSFLLILAMLISILTPMQVEAASKVKINKKSHTMYVGQTYALKISGTSKKVTWSTSNKKVATVDSKGKVVAKKKGTATITAKVAKKKYTCKVTVKTPVLNATKKTLYTGQTHTLKLTGATAKTYSSSNKKIVTVSGKGKVTAKKAGIAKITVKDTKGRKYTCKVTVKTPTINATSKKLDIGKTYTLKLTGATAKTYSSSNTKIATVSSKGKITAKKTGTAKITVKDTKGRKYICKVTVNNCKHSWDCGKTTKKATCTATGVKTYTCNICKATKTETLKKVSHSKGDWEVSQKETCVEFGTKVRKCTVCKQVVEDKTIDPSGHTWGEWKTTKEPTEKEFGEETRICDVCGEKETNTLSKKEHEHQFEAEVTVPTCVSQGYTTYYCRCGDWYVADYVDTVDHIWGNWITVLEPTETTYGEEKRFCQNCDQSESNSLPMTGHEHEYNSWATTPPDCMSSGYTVYYCDCGYIFYDDFVDPLGHIWGEWSVVVEPAEYMDGYKARYCERQNCQERETETLPRLEHEHTYVRKTTASTCTEKGYITCTCRCGDSYIETYLDIDANAHVPGEWVVIEEPAFRVEGLKERACTLCGATETQTIPALGSSEDDIYYVTLRDGTKEAVIGHYDREAEAEMFQLVNEYRVANGYPELTIDDYFQEAADKRGYETAHTWDHKRPNGGSASVTYSYSSENLAWSVYNDPADVLEAWKNSEGHNNNILDDYAWGGFGYNYTGISCFCKLVDDGTYAYYWVQVFR